MGITLIVLALSLLYLVVVVTDATRFTIPNRLNLAILALYPVLFLVSPPDPWWIGLPSFALMFVIGLGLFALGIFGGGDIKLLTVTLLWTGWTAASVMFLIYMALWGGLLALGVIIIRRLVVPLLVKRSPGVAIPRLFMAKQPIPYGLAIAAGFLTILHGEGLPGISL